MRVPRETAAFAAGIRVLCGNWEVIAAALAQIGLGVWQPFDLEVAAREWLAEVTPPEPVMGVDDAVAATRTGRPS